MPLQIGSANKLYYNSATHATPTWVEVNQIEGLSLPDFGINLAEVNIREVAWILNLAAKHKAALEFNLKYNKGNTAFDQIQADFVAKTARQYAVMDEAIATSGAEGLRAFYLIENFPIDEPEEELTAIPVRLALAYHEEASALVTPDWYVVA